MADELRVPPDPQYIPSEAELESKLKSRIAMMESSGDVGVSRPHTGLETKTQILEQKKKEGLRKILEMQHKEQGTLIEDESRHVAPTPPAPNLVKLPEIPAVNKEHEPRGLNWVTIPENYLLTIETISDASQFLAAAKQQRGVPFGLVNPKRGTTCFIRVTEDGTLQMAKPNEDPKAWANPGLGYDGDTDGDNNESKASDYNANTRTTSGWPYLNREAQTLESKDKKIVDKDLFEEINDTMEEALFENYYNKIDIDNISNPAQRALVTKLLTMAKDIRQNNIKDDKEELPLTKNMTLMEEKTEEEFVDLNTLSEMAMKVSLLRKNEDSEQLETIENELIDFIAEALLLNISKIKSSVAEAFVEKIEQCFED